MGADEISIEKCKPPGLENRRGDRLIKKCAIAINNIITIKPQETIGIISFLWFLFHRILSIMVKQRVLHKGKYNRDNKK